jgi:hypothetical protein
MTGSFVRSCLGGFALTLSVGRVAHADSDGYACIGAGFIAIEFRAFNTPGIAGPHVLRVARFDSAGPRWTGEVNVEEFQTHTLACGAQTVLFEGIGEGGRGLVSYTIHIDPTGVPSVVARSNDPHHSFGQMPPGPMNLGNWARPGVMQLPSRASYPRFHLHVTEVTHQVRAGELRHDMKTVLEEIDASGAVRRSLAIHEGTRIETIDTTLDAPTPGNRTLR